MYDQFLFVKYLTQLSEATTITTTLWSFLILQDALCVLSKCCTLVHSSGNDEFLVTKFCQLIVNLFAKQKVCTCEPTKRNFFFEISNQAHQPQQALSGERV